MDVSVVLTHEDRKAIEHARAVVRCLLDGHLELDVFGCPPVALIADELEALDAKIKLELFQPPVRVLELHQGRIA